MKHWNYLKYVLRHKYFVFVAGMKIGASCWRLLVHDLSKFAPAEWPAYVEYFFGEKARLQKEVADDCTYWALAQRYYDAFDQAWLHHQHHNPHHWEHWVLRTSSGVRRAFAMPERYVREMVADWAGAGRAISGRWEVADWYAKNSATMLLHPETKRRVEELLNVWVGGSNATR